MKDQWWNKKVLVFICLAVLYLSLYPAAGVQAAKSLTEQKVQEVGQTPDLVIKTAEDLKNFASKVNGGTGYAGRVVVLDNDIAFNGKVSNNFSSIGDEKHPFNGTFDGRGHTISGLNLMTEYDPALFGCVGSGGLVKNVGVKTVTVKKKTSLRRKVQGGVKYVRVRAGSRGIYGKWSKKKVKL